MGAMTTGVGPHVLAICAAAVLLGGCGASDGPIGFGTAGTIRRAASLDAAHTGNRSSSWMTHVAASQALLYVSSDSNVNVYSYPQANLVGQLAGFVAAWGECGDKSGNVYITDAYSDHVVEYAHGGTQPVAVYTGQLVDPTGCAVDPLGGALAVTTGGVFGSLSGTLAIFVAANQPPTLYANKNIVTYGFCGYDARGNLFVDGINASWYPELAVLRHGSSALEGIKVNDTVGPLGAVQWDGKYLAVGQAIHPAIYRYRIRGNRGAVVGSTALTAAYQAHQFQIVEDRAIVANQYYHNIYEVETNVIVFDYPACGQALEVISEGLGGSIAEGLDLSKAPI
jgi:hypothetical protein